MIQKMMVKQHRVNLTDEPPFLIARRRWKFIPALVRDFGFKEGVEIGVERGAFSDRLLGVAPGLHMFAVDPWLSYGYFTTSDRYSQDVMDRKYQHAVAVLGKRNCTILKMFSHEAAERFDDASIDFVFIDGAHDYDNVYQDISLWEPKVRPGGLVCGHDYYNNSDPMRCKVKDAVDDWTREHGVKVWFVLVGSRLPSWLWMKGESA